MPIQGLTNRPDQGRFTQIGELRKGAPKGADRPGKDLDFFRFTTSDERAAADFAQQYGDEPNNIEILLPYATIDENLFAFRELWTGSKLMHRCDGDQVWEWANGVLTPTGRPCPTRKLPERDRNKCRPVGRLTVILPCLNRFAYVAVLTTSTWDIVHMTEEIAAIQSIAGNLQGIPMILSRRPQSISAPKGNAGERQRITKSLIHVEIDPVWAKRKMLNQRAAAELAWNEPAARLLPGPALQVVNTQTGELIGGAPDDDDAGDDDAANDHRGQAAQDVDPADMWLDDDSDVPPGPGATFDPVGSDPRQEAEKAKADRRAEADRLAARSPGGDEWEATADRARRAESAAAPLGTVEERDMAANAELLGHEPDAPANRTASPPKGRRTEPAGASAQAQVHREQRGESRANRAQAEADRQTEGIAEDAAPQVITPQMIKDGWDRVNRRWQAVKMPDPKDPTKIRQISSNHWSLNLRAQPPEKMRALFDQIGVYLRQADEREAEFAKQIELPY